MRIRKKYIVSAASTFKGVRPDGAPFDYGQQYSVLGVCSSMKKARAKTEKLVKEMSGEMEDSAPPPEVRTEGDTTIVTMKGAAYTLEYRFEIKRVNEDA